MKLNTSILAHELSDLNPRICGDTDQELTLSDVRLLAHQRQLSAEHLYLVTLEQIRNLDDRNATVACIGGNDASDYLIERGMSGLVFPCELEINEVLERIQDVFLHFNVLEHELMEAVLREDPLDSLANICAKFFRNHVFILDVSLSFIAWSDNYTYLKAAKGWRECFSTRIVSPGLINTLNREGLTPLLHRAAKAMFMEMEPEYGLGISVNSMEAGQRVATVCVLETDTRVSRLQLGLADFVAAKLTKPVLKYHGNAFYCRTQLRDCMERMLRGQGLDKGIIASHLSCLGWKPDDDYLLLRILFRPHIFSNGTPEHSMKIYESLFPGCISLDMDETFVMLLHGTGSDVTIAQGIAALPEYLKKVGAVCAISLPFSDLMMLKEHFLLTGAALELGAPASNLLRYEDIMMEHLISECAKVLPLRAFCHRQVLQIHEHDRQAGGDLLLSLQVYLQRERSLKAASEELHIHRNTLVYRIERISKIADLPLDDPQSRMHVLLSCMILRYLDNLASGLTNSWQAKEIADAI